MGLYQKFLTWIGKSSLVWVWKISPKNPKFFKFFPSDQKKCHWVNWVKEGSASYLLWVKSMLGSRSIDKLYLPPENQFKLTL